MEKFTVITLIDITETKQYRKEPDKELEIKQQQNFLTLMQTIGMRVNPSYPRPPAINLNFKQEKLFGSKIAMPQKAWKFDFYFDYHGGLTDGQGNPCGLLLDDLHLIPVISDLTESVALDLAVFNTKSPEFKNTVIFPEADK
jgi:hypothetical protein